jgi:hypothetical protein
MCMLLNTSTHFVICGMCVCVCLCVVEVGQSLTVENEGITFFRNVGNHTATQRHISEDRYPQLHCCGTLNLSCMCSCSEAS